MKELSKIITVVVLSGIVSWVLGSCLAKADTIKIAVIDTGFDFNGKWATQPKLCKNGHKDFTDTSLNDTNSHGTHIASLISKNNEEINYCLLILKFYTEKGDNLERETKALEWAILQKVDVINLSLGGYGRSPKECFYIKKALDANIKIIAAAGNDGKDILKKPYYPAMCDKRVIIVGNGIREKLANTSNFIINMKIENGQNVLGSFPNNKYGRLSGTSQATAIYTSKTLRNLQMKLCTKCKLTKSNKKENKNDFKRINAKAR